MFKRARIASNTRMKVNNEEFVVFGVWVDPAGSLLRSFTGRMQNLLCDMSARDSLYQKDKKKWTDCVWSIDLDS